MNTMNMPGFTAEVSLSKTSGHYQSIRTQSHSSGGQGVISQLSVGDGFYSTSGSLSWGGPVFRKCYMDCRRTGKPWLRCLLRCL